MSVVRWRAVVARVAPPLLICGIPILLLCGGVARYILNHFFAQAPYLLDSGLLSAVSYRSGLLLETPPMAIDYATSFYQVYFSPIISVFSGLSYVAPVDRIEWFAFVQAAMYLPIALAVYAFASRLEPETRIRRLPMTVAAAIAFSMCGLVLWTVGFPHYEVATPGLVCIVIAGLATGRTRLAYVALGLAASIRQDGGVHVVVALLPLLYLRWRGAELKVTRRQIITMIAVAIATTMAAFVLQRLFFVPADRLKAVYLGVPIYGHLSLDMLAERARYLIENGQGIYYPLLVTVAIAIARRDARYLLGWAATVPWFLFNFLAYEESKSQFQAYTVGPFIVAIFWIYVYGGLLAPPARRIRPVVLEALLIVVCLASTYGVFRAAPAAMSNTAQRMAFTYPGDRAAMHAFVDALHASKPRLGRLYVDQAVAALALEELDLANNWHPGVRDADTIVFHRLDVSSQLALADVFANQLDACLQVLGTGIVVCSREPVSLPVPTTSSSAVFAYSRLDASGVHVDARGVRIEREKFSTRLGALAAGAYTLELTLDGPVQVEVNRDGTPLALFELDRGGAHSLAFIAPGGDAPITVHFAATSPFTVSAARLLPATPAGGPGAR